MVGRNPANELNDVDRMALIQEISDRASITYVDTATWACLWLADVSKLREIVHCLRGADYEAGMGKISQIHTALEILRRYILTADYGCENESIKSEGSEVPSKRPADFDSNSQTQHPPKTARLSLRKKVPKSPDISEKTYSEEAAALFNNAQGPHQHGQAVISGAPRIVGGGLDDSD
ncbi:hypothetical protein BDW62DRAFT_204363 [Aspergillus aurantiobrunneus]